MAKAGTYSRSASPGAAGFSYRPALHRLAQLIVAATVLLIFMGGLVTSHGAGMSVPDWPNSFGYNMFLLPPSAWLSRQAGGVFYEHSHRLMATVVGLLSIALTAQAWGWASHRGARVWIGRCCVIMLALFAVAVVVDRSVFARESGVARMAHHGAAAFGGMAVVLGIFYFARAPEPRRWVRWLAAATLAAVIFQGLLGGLRVVLVNLNLAVVHACFAQAFLCLGVLMTIVTSRWHLNAGAANADRRAARSVYRVAMLAAALVYVQLVVGALMRHYDAGLAVPDFPLSYGKIVPPVSAEALSRINWERTVTLGLRPVSLGQIWLHTAHRAGALVVTVVLIGLIARVWVLRRRLPGLATLATLTAVGLASQVTLGICTVLYRKPADVASTHVAVGAMVLALTFALAARARTLWVAGRLAELSESVKPGGVAMDLRPPAAENAPAFQPA